MKCFNEGCNNEAKIKFCSKSCSATVNNKVPKRKRINERNCLRCNKYFNGNRHAIYCSMGCSANYRREIYIQRWLVGLETGSMNNGSYDPRIKNYLLEQANYKCSKCFWGEPNPTTGKPILTIDHIDGNWKNNKVNNLILICYNCHTLTPTFGSLNKGKNIGFRSVGSRR